MGFAVHDRFPHRGQLPGLPERDEIPGPGQPFGRQRLQGVESPLLRRIAGRQFPQLPQARLRAGDGGAIRFEERRIPGHEVAALAGLLSGYSGGKLFGAGND